MRVSSDEIEPVAAAVPEDRPILVRVAGLGMTYGAVRVLAGLDLDVRDGEFLTLLGPSGSGKTTLLRLIAGLATPTEGSILLGGEDIARVPIERRPFNTVFQDYALFPHMRVRDNVAFGLRVRGVPRRTVAAKVDAALAAVEMAAFADRWPAALSGGQRQRVALARALVCEPRLVLLDEPLSALDATLRRQMQVFLKETQRRSGITFLFVTHDQAEAMTVSDRVCVMAGGAIRQLGTPREVYDRPADRFVAGFFGDNNLVGGCRVVARSGGIATVDGPLGRLSVAAEGHGAVTLAVRPEALTLAGAGAQNALPCRVRDVWFAGSETLIELVAGDVRLLMKAKSNPRAAPPSPGADLLVAFDPAAAALLPEEPA